MNERVSFAHVTDITRSMHLARKNELIRKRYTTNGLETLRDIETERKPYQDPLTNVLQQVLQEHGIAYMHNKKPIMVSDRNIVELGCGNGQLSNWLFGTGLKGIKIGGGTYHGFDLVPKINTHLACPGEVSGGVDILDPSFPQILKQTEADVLLEFDTSGTVEPNPENLGRIIRLYQQFLTGHPERDALLVYTFAATSDYWSAGEVIIHPQSTDEHVQKVQRAKETSGGIYNLTDEDLQIAADELIPIGVAQSIVDNGDLSPFFRHLDECVIPLAYALDGHCVTLLDSLKTYLQEGQDVYETLMAKFNTYTYATPAERINLAYSVIPILTQITKIIDAEIKSNYNNEHPFGSHFSDPLYLLEHPFQLAMYKAVMEERFKRAGLQVSSGPRRSDLITTEKKSRQLNTAKPTDFQYCLTTDPAEMRYMTHQYWGVGRTFGVRNKPERDYLQQQAQIYVIHLKDSQ